MNSRASDSASQSTTVAPAGDVRWHEPSHYRDGESQAAFESSVAKLWAQDSWLNPRSRQRELNADLVLEGGGVKGIGLAGAICTLAEAGYRFPRAAGTSAGAIAAVLVAAVQKSGQPMSVLHDYLSDIDYPQFMDPAPAGHLLEKLAGEIRDIYQLVSRGGLYTGDYLGTWLGGKLDECDVHTWADLAITTEDDPDMDLPDGQRYRAVVHVSDITRGTLARLPWDYQQSYGLPADDQKVVSSVRASMSIPFFFVPVRTHTFPAQENLPGNKPIRFDGGTVTWVDGGMLMNFPIGAFDRSDGKPARWPTIGIKLSAAPGRQPADTPVDNALDEGYRCIKTMTSEWDRYHIDSESANRTIFVPNDGIAATQFDLTKEQQATLFGNGVRAATEFLIKCAHRGGVPRSSG